MIALVSAFDWHIPLAHVALGPLASWTGLALVAAWAALRGRAARPDAQKG
jgi:hypothetical protein